jgi:cytochrome c oxidase cbb3-type subunit 3
VRKTTRVLAVVGVILALAGCSRTAPAAGTGTPLASAIPPGRTAVGPIPGPIKTVNQPGSPFDGNPAALADGRTLFNQFNCAGCHGDHGGGGMGPSLRDGTWIYGHADSQVFSSIAEGRANGMPAWGMRLNDDQIWKLVTYIKSMRTNAEPDRPQP